MYNDLDGLKFELSSHCLGPLKITQLDSGIIVVDQQSADSAAAHWAENTGDGIEDY